MSAIAIFKGAWRNRDKLGDANQTRELAAFLPATLEIQETPPNPLARWLAWFLLVLVIIATTWSFIGNINIVASAEGKIIPSSRVKQVQPLEKGVVKAVLVSEGEYVAQGQPLIELDTTMTLADIKGLDSELHSSELRIAVNRALLFLIEESDHTITLSYIENFNLKLPAGTSKQNRLLHESMLKQKWLQYQSQMSVLKSSLARIRAEQATAREIITKLEKTLPIAEKRAAKLEVLFTKEFVSENDYLRVEQELIQIVQDLAAERHRFKQLLASESEAHEKINLHKSQVISSLITEVADLQSKTSVLEKELTKATDLNAKQILYAPIAGRVQELSINTVGGVVTEAQQLMLIVPDEEQLEVEAYLENKDIGFVSEGMQAEIKVHTFPFTKYGVIDAEIITVSDDAIVDEKLGLVYRMQLTIAKNKIGVNGGELGLMPGMAVTVEVNIGKRRIIEFFLAPLLKVKSESIRER